MAKALETSGELAEAVEWCDTLFELAEGKISRGKVFILKARLNELQGRWSDAINDVREGLRVFDVALPDDPVEISRQQNVQIARVMETLDHQSIDSLLALPEVSDEKIATIMELLFRVVPPAVQINPPLFILADLMLFNYTARYGTSFVSGKNFVDCAIIVGSIFQKYELGYELGSAAYRLLDQYPNSGLECGVDFVYATYVSHWREYFPASVERFERSILFGLETGDLSHTSYAFAHLIYRKLFTGSSLPECAQTVSRTIEFLQNAQTRDQNALADIAGRSICAFQEECPGGATDTRIDDDEYILQLMESGNAVDIAIAGQMVAWISWLQRDFPAAIRWSRKAEPYIYSTEGMFHTADFYLIRYLSIQQLLNGPSATESVVSATRADATDKSLEEQLSEAIGRLKQWANLCPMNFAHKYHFACAEELKAKKACTDSVKKEYAQALDAIQNGHFLHMAAAIYEYRSRFLLQIHELSAAKSDLSHAIDLYRQWGAIPKACALDAELNQLS